MMLVVVIGDGGGEAEIPVVGDDCSGGGDRR